MRKYLASRGIRYWMFVAIYCIAEWRHTSSAAKAKLSLLCACNVIRPYCCSKACCTAVTSAASASRSRRHSTRTCWRTARNARTTARTVAPRSGAMPTCSRTSCCILTHEMTTFYEYILHNIFLRKLMNNLVSVVYSSLYVFHILPDYVFSNECAMTFVLSIETSKITCCR